jgi:hypothetical protein
MRCRVNNTYMCAVCDRPINLQTCETNARGKAIHSECAINSFRQMIFVERRARPAAGLGAVPPSLTSPLRSLKFEKQKRFGAN